MKILYLNGGATPIKDLAIEKLTKLGHDVIFYDPTIDKSEAFRWSTKHFQMYENVLDKAEDLKVDLLYFSTSVSMPEYLLFELRSRPEFKPNIIFHLMLRGLSRSISRCLALKELVDMPQIRRVVANVMISDRLVYPQNMIDAGTNFNKFLLVNESFNTQSEDLDCFGVSKESARRHFGIPEDAFVVLQSGTWAYIKGVDIFIEALRDLKNNITPVIHKHPYGEDQSLDKDLLAKAKINHPNTIIIDRWLSPMEYPALFRAADIVVCAHRWSYEYGESGIPGIACKAKRPIMVPDYYFFNEIIKRHDVGYCYSPENAFSMAEMIGELKNNYSNVVNNARFDDAIANYGNDISDIPVKALLGL